jgi:hypothetical protein
LRFLDETVQQYHLLLSDTENHTRDAAVADVTADFVQTLAERAADRHSDRPAELGSGDVLADRTTVDLVQALQPFPHWLVARTLYPDEAGDTDEESGK